MLQNQQIWHFRLVAWKRPRWKRQKFVSCNKRAETKQLHDAVSTALRLAQIKKSNCNEKATLFLCKQLECQLYFALLSENTHVERGKSLFCAMKKQKQNNYTTLFRSDNKAKMSNLLILQHFFTLFALFNKQWYNYL